MRMLLSGYGSGSKEGDQARQYRTLRFKASDAVNRIEVQSGGVVSKDGRRSWTSLNIPGRTSKVGGSSNNDVELLIYDVSPEECAALIGRLFRLAEKDISVRRGKDYAGANQDVTKLTKTVMGLVCGALDGTYRLSHLEVLRSFIELCEKTQSQWMAFHNIARVAEQHKRPSTDPPPSVFFSSYEEAYRRALPHLKAALNILNGSEPEAGAENVVALKSEPNEAT